MKPVILLIDDNEEILDYLFIELNEKYSILKAFNGQEALAIIKKEVIELIVCDVMMPKMDGFELCEIVKKDFEYSHIPFIILTAKNTLQAKIEGLELGADAYIEKPFSPEYLRVQIASLLFNRNKIKEYFIHSPLVHLKSIAHSKTDELFLEKLNESICINLQDTELDVDKLAKDMNMSRPTLYRKIKSVTDITPNELINITRLKKAAEILADDTYKIYEVADMVGYGSKNNFARNFSKQFGMTPSEFLVLKQSRKKQE